MNRYRSIPGITGQQKAASTTLCQKCLKKDESPDFCLLSQVLLTSLARHYSYECKAGAQERPYVSRPSRTQQLLNPNLAPKLNSDVPNDLLRKKGIADEQLARAEEERGRTKSRLSASPPPKAAQSRKRSRSLSSHTSDSVSTISTNRSISPKRARKGGQDKYITSQAEEYIPEYKPRSTKRRYSSSSVSGSRSRSISSQDQPYRSDQKKSFDDNRRRRHNLASPEPRGRPEAHRRGSRRTQSRSLSVDKSRVARGRKSLTPLPERPQQDRRVDRDDRPEDSARWQHNGVENRPFRRDGPARKGQHLKRERSLSPYSKRLALTQAMNL